MDYKLTKSFAHINLLFYCCRGLKTRVRVFPGATDSRYVRYAGIPAIGFSPINNTPLLLHDHDEYLRASTYLHGIEVYKKLISAVSNV